MAYISQIKTPDGTTYDINAKKVNGHSVQSDVPANAVFGGVSDVTVDDVSIVENNIAKLRKVNAYYDGIVPAGRSVSTQTQSTKFLREDGQWSIPSYSANTTYTFNTGTSQGQIRVHPSDGESYDVTVKGLAIKNGKVVLADAESPMTGTLYACCNDQNGYLAVQVPWTNTTYSLSTGDSNGQIKVTPSSGSAYNVSVKGLGSAAYLTASTSATANTVAQRQGNGYLYAVYYNTSCGSEDPGSYTSYAAFIDSNGWLRKSSRLNFAKYLTNQSISSPGYFVTLTNSWGSFGYSTPAQTRSGLGLGGCATQSISYHTVACNIPSGSLYKDYSVTYSSRTVDAVIPCIWTGTTSQANVCIPVITNVTSTSTTIRVWKQVGATTNNPEPSLKILIVYH